MGIEFQRGSDFVERRRAPREAVQFAVAVRERGRSALVVRAAELTALGCRIEGYLTVAEGTQVWVKLPGLESVAGQVVWSLDGTVGIAFERPLHPAVAARFIPGAAAEAPAPAANDGAAPTLDHSLLSRREQIVAGIVAAERSPLQRRKGKSGLSLAGFITRQVARQIDTRAEPRFADAIPNSPGALRVAGAEAEVRNVSSSGLSVRGAPAGEIGDQLEVEFEGFEAYSGRLVWRRDDAAGIALPPQTIDLCDG